MSALERTASGAFRAEDAIALDKIKEMEPEQVWEAMTGPDFPLVHRKRPALPMRDEYAAAYNVYQRSRQGKIFLGVAFFDKKYKKFAADKVLSRGDII